MSSSKVTNDKQKMPTQAKFNSDIISDDAKFNGKKLIEACLKDCLEEVEWLVEYTKADVNYSGEIVTKNAFCEDIIGYYTPLTAACDKGCLDVVKYLMKSGASVNLKEPKEGDLPLTAACGSGHIFVAMFLLLEVDELDVNIPDGNENSALHYAVSCYENNNGRTPLHEACFENNLDEVRRIVYERDYLINRQDNGGYTPLHYACMFDASSDPIGSRNPHNSSRSAIVITLMMDGADETSTNFYGKTPAEVAEEMGHSYLLTLLNTESLWPAIQKKSLEYFFYQFFILLNVTRRLNTINNS